RRASPRPCLRQASSRRAQSRRIRSSANKQRWQTPAQAPSMYGSCFLPRGPRRSGRRVRLSPPTEREFSTYPQRNALLRHAPWPVCRRFTGFNALTPIKPSLAPPFQCKGNGGTAMENRAFRTVGPDEAGRADLNIVTMKRTALAAGAAFALALSACATGPSAGGGVDPTVSSIVKGDAEALGFDPNKLNDIRVALNGD